MGVLTKMLREHLPIWVELSPEEVDVFLSVPSTFSRYFGYLTSRAVSGRTNTQLFTSRLSSLKKFRGLSGRREVQPPSCVHLPLQPRPAGKAPESQEPRSPGAKARGQSAESKAWKDRPSQALKPTEKDSTIRGSSIGPGWA